MPTEKAEYVIQHGAEGYTTNAPLEELMDDDVLIADEFVAGTQRSSQAAGRSFPQNVAARCA
jgi:DMSO/TMAO reductase YedYZ molybdopterin-dependent catalytic subunit